MSIGVKLLLLTILQAAASLVFLRGFLLTRVELPDVAECQGPTCSSQLPPPYQKAVILIVDAVRYDFLCQQDSANGRPTASLMPKTLHWVQSGVRCSAADSQQRATLCLSTAGTLCQPSTALFRCNIKFCTALLPVGPAPCMHLLHCHWHCVGWSCCCLPLHCGHTHNYNEQAEGVTDGEVHLRHNTACISSR